MLCRSPGIAICGIGIGFSNLAAAAVVGNNGIEIAGADAEKEPRFAEIFEIDGTVESRLGQNGDAIPV